MRCDKCKHWGKSEVFGQAEEIFQTKRCGKAVQLWDAGDWTGQGSDYVLKTPFVDQLMFVKDGSDYRADLYTKGDFFCAHFEEISE